MAIVNTFNSNYVSTAIATVPSGTERFVLFIHAQVGGGAYDIPPTGATINGQAMTLYASSGNNEQSVRIFGYAIPDSWSAGNYTITPSGHSQFNRWHVAVFTGVDGSSPVVGGAGSRIGVSTNDSISNTVDTVENGWVHDAVITGVQKYAGSGQTVLYNETGRGGISYKSNVSAGTATMSWSWTDSRSGHGAVSLRPSVPKAVWSCLV